MNAGVPHFIGIGAHRGGTSWLFSQLRRHPRIWMPPVKELHYFSRAPRYPSPDMLAIGSPLRRLFGANANVRARMRSGLYLTLAAAAGTNWEAFDWHRRWYLGRYDDAWYTGLFARVASSQVTGEITPAYSMLDAADVARMVAVNPAAKIVFMLRNPIERAWSALRFDVDRGHLALDLESPSAVIAATDMLGMRLRGDYLRTLEVFKRHFSGRILLGFHDAISAQPVDLLDGVTTFLGVAALDPDSIDPAPVNTAPARAMPEALRSHLVERYEPMMAQLAARCGGYAEAWYEQLNDGRQSAATGAASCVVV